MTVSPFDEKEVWKPLKRGSVFDGDPSKPAQSFGAHHDLSERGIMTTRKLQMKYVVPP